MSGRTSLELVPCRPSGSAAELPTKCPTGTCLKSSEKLKSSRANRTLTRSRKNKGTVVRPLDTRTLSVSSGSSES